jgi:hypothetical protein
MGEFVSHYWILCAGAWPRARLPGQPAIEWPGSFYFRWLYNSSKAGLRVSETQHYLWHWVAGAAAGRGFCGAGWAIDNISGHRQGADGPSCNQSRRGPRREACARARPACSSLRILAHPLHQGRHARLALPADEGRVPATTMMSA